MRFNCPISDLTQIGNGLILNLYAAAITRLDSHVGRIIQELKDQGDRQKTVILFTSDNGDENSYYKYTKRFGATGPLKGKKRFLYEGGIRVPMIARWPGQIRPAQTSRIPAAGWDIMATLAELAGIASPTAHQWDFVHPHVARTSEAAATA